MKYIVKGLYEYTSTDKVYIEVEADSKEEALELAKLQPEHYEIDYKNIDISGGKFIAEDEWVVLNDWY